MQIDLFNPGGAPREGAKVQAADLDLVARERYLNYALSVITSRALPDVRDGFKPVQRRILYTMYQDLKLRADTRFLKSARVVGDVMGKYHPHGDQAIYDAMVRMAQPFSLRYPLVDGQGNFGSIDGDGAAAMRYTEARLQAISEDLLDEIKADTVSFQPTYDGQLQEPSVLPAQLPNLLINGATGIAVGMATHIPPHNLREIIDALQLLSLDPATPLELLLKKIKGPDFPGGGEILSTQEEIQAVYEVGQGPIRVRGTYEVEIVNKKQCVILTSLPYAVNKAALVEKIAQLIIDRKLPQLVDIRDESAEDTRVVMELRRGADPQVAMAYLYKHTPLEGNFNVNMTCLVPDLEHGGMKPLRLGLKEVLQYFLDFRFEITEKRFKHKLKKIKETIHRLEGFEKIFNHLDEVLNLIRESQNREEISDKLQARFQLSEVQISHVLDMKIYRLARLEILSIQAELEEKRREQRSIEALLSNPESMKQLIRDELHNLRKTYGDRRRTQLAGPDEEHTFDAERYILREGAWVFLSRQGRLKRQGGFTEIGAVRVPDGDQIGWAIRTDTTRTLTFFTQKGIGYVMRVDKITSTTGYGDPIQAIFNFSDGEQIIAVIAHDDQLLPPAGADGERYGIALTKQGRIARFPLSLHADISTKSGRKVMLLVDDDALLGVVAASGADLIGVATSRGRALLFASEEIPIKLSAVRGVQAIKLSADDHILGFQATANKREGLRVRTGRGRDVTVCEASFPIGKRGSKGTVVLRVGRLELPEASAEIIVPPSEATPQES